MHTTVRVNARPRFMILVIGLGLGIGIGLLLLALFQLEVLSGARGGGAVAPENQVTVIARNMRFGDEPVRLKAGETVTLMLINEEFVPHSFDVDGLNIHAEMPLKGKTALTVTAPKAGTYELYCGVPGHREAGMMGTLIVEP